MRDVAIQDEMIRLGQLLQLAGVADGGAEAKHLILAGEVRVNGDTEVRRGRQLHDGDVIELSGEVLRVSVASA